jgi:F-type H+-transporting ATPase subunit delta
MAELATIARPYAEALFQAVGADLSQSTDWLEELAAVASEPQLLDFAAHPKSTVDQVVSVVCGVLKARLPAEGENLLRLVVENGRLQVLPEVATQFRALKNAKSGTADATVYSAFPIESPALAELSVLLEKRFGKRLNLSVELTPELIGGIRVAVGDEVLDTSIKARLEQMKAALTA